MGYVLIHTLVSRLSDENTKVRNISSWCLRYLRDPRSVRPLLRLIQSTQTKDYAKAAAVAGLLELGDEFDITSISPQYIDNIMREMTEFFVSLLQDEIVCEWAVDEFISLPSNVQLQMVEYFNEVHNEAMGRFVAEINEQSMYLSEEVSREFRKLLYKLKSAGIEVKGLDNMHSQKLFSFHKAMASCTRDDGGISLFIAWEKPNGKLRVALFIIEFAGNGIAECSVVHEMTKEEFNLGMSISSEKICDELTFAPLTLEQSRFLLREGYRINTSEGTKVPSDFRKFKWLVEDDVKLTESDIDMLVHSLIAQSNTPKTVVAAFYSGFSHFDFPLVYSLLGTQCAGRKWLGREEFAVRMEHKLTKEHVCYHGFKINEHIPNEEVHVIKAECVISIANKYYRVYDTFLLAQENGLWKITEHKRGNHEQLTLAEAVRILDEGSDKANYIRAFFEVVNYTKAYNILESLDTVEFVEENEGGTLFLWVYENDDNTGIWGMIEVNERTLTVTVDGALRLDVLLSTLERELGDSIKFNKVESVVSDEFWSQMTNADTFRNCYRMPDKGDDLL